MMRIMEKYVCVYVCDTCVCVCMFVCVFSCVQDVQNIHEGTPSYEFLIKSYLGVKTREVKFE